MNVQKTLNTLALVLILLALILKTNKLEGLSITLVLSAIAMLSALGMYAIKDNREAGMSNGINYLLVAIVALLIIGNVMKVQHWQGYALVLVPAYALLPIALIGLILQKNKIQISNQFYISFLSFFIFLMVAIPKNPFFLNQFQRGHEAEEECLKREHTENNCCYKMKQSHHGE